MTYNSLFRSAKAIEPPTATTRIHRRIATTAPRKRRFDITARARSEPMATNPFTKMVSARQEQAAKIAAELQHAADPHKTGTTDGPSAHGGATDVPDHRGTGQDPHSGAEPAAAAPAASSASTALHQANEARLEQAAQDTLHHADDQHATRTPDNTAAPEHPAAQSSGRRSGSSGSPDHPFNSDLRFRPGGGGRQARGLAALFRSGDCARRRSGSRVEDSGVPRRPPQRWRVLFRRWRRERCVPKPGRPWAGRRGVRTPRRRPSW